MMITVLNPMRFKTAFISVALVTTPRRRARAGGTVYV